eukprot:3689190-Rhodomonas_salina.1
MPNCPVNTSILAQYVDDLVEGGLKPNLLTFDILRYGGVDQRNLPPAQRYATLRGVSEWYNPVFMSMQWAGEYAALRGFLAQNKASPMIPHAISHTLVLTTNPLQPLVPRGCFGDA